jgi:hypothetical protein
MSSSSAKISHLKTSVQEIVDDPDLTLSLFWGLLSIILFALPFQISRLVFSRLAILVSTLYLIFSVEERFNALINSMLGQTSEALVDTYRNPTELKEQVVISVIQGGIIALSFFAIMRLIRSLPYDAAVLLFSIAAALFIAVYTN